MTIMSEQNRAAVLRLFEHVMNGRISDALAFVGEDYIEHNPAIGTGRSGLEAYLRDISNVDPSPRLEIQRVIADSNYVVVHMHTLWGQDRPDTAAIDIFRLRDGLIVEHWDVVQPIGTAEAG